MTSKERPPHPLETQFNAMAQALLGKGARALDKAEFEQVVTFWRTHRYWKPGDPVTEDATPNARRVRKSPEL